MNCHDCPDLEFSPDAPVGVEFRARCCRDEHIERRIMGHHDAWEGTARARQISEDEEARMTRQQRRFKKRKGKR